MIEQFVNFCLALVTFHEKWQKVAIEDRINMKYSEVSVEFT